MKVGTDSVLLGAWAELPETAGASVLDVGTGTGVVALMMAQRYPQAAVTAIDIDAGAAEEATGNAARSPFADRVAVRHCALQRYEGGSFGAIVCNPPYFSGSLRCADARRTLARHTDSLGCGELFRHAARLLSPGGEFSLIIPSDSLGRAEEAAAFAGLFLRRCCLVRTAEGKAPKRVLLAYKKTPQRAVADEMALGGGACNDLLSEFYL